MLRLMNFNCSRKRRTLLFLLFVCYLLSATINFSILTSSTFRLVLPAVGLPYRFPNSSVPPDNDLSLSATFRTHYQSSTVPLAESSAMEIVFPPPALPWEDAPQMNEITKTVTILQWNNVYGSGFRPEGNTLPKWCTITMDRSRVNEAQAIVLHTVGADLNLSDLPSNRPPHQIRVMFSIEPPSYWPQKSAYERLNAMGIHKTMTFRLDSDYPSPYAYARMGSEPTVDMKNKTKLVAWMVSHCRSLSDREALVEELKTLIPIDIYGSCGTLKCPKDSTQEENCYKQLGQTYKFFLSFENSLCRGYISEKYSNALKHGLVPVVYGGGNYSEILPHSKVFINAKSFTSMKLLANYLLYLNGNDTAYKEYFEWRQHYTLRIRVGYDGYRRLCNALQTGDQNRTKMYDIRKWWLDDAHCGQAFTESGDWGR